MNEMKKTVATIGLILLCCLCQTLVGCGKEKKNLKEFETLIDELDTIESIVEAQGDYKYVLTDTEDIGIICELIKEGNIEPVYFSKNDIGPFPTGGPELSFNGSNGTSLSCFVKDYYHFKYDLVCDLYTNTGSSIYCYNLNDDTFRNILGIVYKGEYRHLTDPIK